MTNTRTTLLAVGCSFTKGHGLPDEIHNNSLWVNRLAHAVDAAVVNKSVTGVNNDWIFHETISEILKNEYDIIIVSWSAIPRYRFYVGLELYSTSTMLSLTSNGEININNKETISAKWQKETGNRLRKIHNDHWDILNLVKYVNLLNEIQCTHRKGQIFFVNALGPWCKNYFNFETIKLPSELDTYVQTLLNADTRDDSEILDLYSMIHQQYQSYGGILEHKWLNLYESLEIMKVDTVSDTDKHPGIKSQLKFSEKLTPVLLKNLIKTQ
jgi:hypothetical protein